jgi:ankyrin repeat protein
LLFATRQGDAYIVNMLLDAGANINDAMCTSGPSARVRFEELAGKDFNSDECSSGLNALMIASLGGFTDVAEALLNRGADPNMVDKSGKTVLHHSAASRVEIVKALLAHGADPNLRVSNPKGSGRYGLRVTEQGATALVIAADYNNLEIVNVLLDAGADPFISTEQKTSALLMAAGAGTSPADSLTDEAIAAATEIVRIMVNKGVDVNARGPFGWTALHAAAYHGRNDIIDLLVQNGANPNLMDDFGQTPLSIAYAIVTEGIGDNYNQTPRIYRTDTAELLLSLGASPLESSGVKIVAERAIE